MKSALTEKDGKIRVTGKGTDKGYGKDLRKNHGKDHGEDHGKNPRLRRGILLFTRLVCGTPLSAQSNAPLSPQRGQQERENGQQGSWRESAPTSWLPLRNRGSWREAPGGVFPYFTSTFAGTPLSPSRCSGTFPSKGTARGRLCYSLNSSSLMGAMTFSSVPFSKGLERFACFKSSKYGSEPPALQRV